ncbi:hypothetical protein AMTRI_Chr01g136880 [Amborella trichopoda]
MALSPNQPLPIQMSTPGNVATSWCRLDFSMVSLEHWPIVLPTQPLLKLSGSILKNGSRMIILLSFFS